MPNNIGTDLNNGTIEQRDDYAFITRITEVMRELGYDDSEIARSGSLGIPETIETVDFTERPDLRVASQLAEWDDASKSPHTKLKDVLRWSPRAFSAENFNSTNLLSDPIEATVGYTIQKCTVDGSPWSGYELSHTSHPEAFRIQLQQLGDGSTVDEFAFRFPPGQSHLNLSAVAFAVSDQLLNPRGYTIRKLDPSSRLRTYLLFERDRLQSLQETYGRRLRMFADVGCDGPILAEQSLVEDALGYWYDSEQELDHETEYGITEPSNTFKVEDQPEAEHLLTAEGEV